MAGKIQAIRGMHDVLPDQSPYWRQMENAIIDVLKQYDYHEIRLPVVEKTELFQRSIGEDTDIVSKEMYTFTDRNGESLTLRPEGTAGCVRAGLEHGLFHNQVRKLWYLGPMFRHERPQKGRQRQFHQVGIEAFGLEGPDIDTEIILLCARIFRALNIEVTLELNSLGSLPARQAYRDILVEFLSKHKQELDEDSRRRLHSNPLRILDSKNPAMQALISAAPALLEHIDNESKSHFEALCRQLDEADVTYTINPRLVRGLDYYCRTVFEWTTDRLGAQGTLCAGGRFDGLIEHFGGRPTPAIGCALGLERLLELLLTEQKVIDSAPHACLIMGEGEVAGHALTLAEQWRNALPALRLLTVCGGGSFKSQFKKADKSGARYALIFGEQEHEQQSVGIKSLREKTPQFNLPLDEVPAWLEKNITTELNLG